MGDCPGGKDDEISKKTKVLCVSDVLNYKARSYLYTADGERLESTDSLKILGFYMDSRPSCHAHVAAIKVWMREKVWILRHLAKTGFTETELAQVYKTVIRPVLDYCAVVYNSMLTDEQDQIVERLQSQALKSIYGYKTPYAEMRRLAGVTTHRERRVEFCDKFARKAPWPTLDTGTGFLGVGRVGLAGVEKNSMNSRLERIG